ncbi:unnamed protein product [Urochloa humidicola]
MADKSSRALILDAAGHATLLTAPAGSSATAGSHLNAVASSAPAAWLPHSPLAVCFPSHKRGEEHRY